MSTFAARASSVPVKAATAKESVKFLEALWKKTVPNVPGKWLVGTTDNMEIDFYSKKDGDLDLILNLEDGRVFVSVSNVGALFPNDIRDFLSNDGESTNVVEDTYEHLPDLRYDTRLNMRELKELKQSVADSVNYFLETNKQFSSFIKELDRTMKVELKKRK